VIDGKFQHKHAHSAKKIKYDYKIRFFNLVIIAFLHATTVESNRVSVFHFVTFVMAHLHICCNM